MKKWSKLLSVPVAVALLAACGTDDAGEDTTEDVTEEPATEEVVEDDAATEEDTTGEEAVEEDDAADAETGASVIQGADDVQRAFSADAEWIAILTEDTEVEEDLTFEHQDNEEGERKMAFYESDDDDNITLFTLTAPSVTVEAENTRFAARVVGDVIVDANGFNFYNEPEIDGDLIFTSEEYMESAEYDEAAVSGEVRVEEQ